MSVNDLDDDLFGLPGSDVNLVSEAEVVSTEKPKKKRVWKGQLVYQNTTSGKAGIVDKVDISKIEATVVKPKAKNGKVDIIADPSKMSKKELAKMAKENKLVKDVFAETFMDLQYLEQFNLKTWAMANQTEFYKLAAKLIPVQLTGEGGGPLALKNVTFE